MAHIHPNAIVESQQIGVNTHVWAFAHILPGARIGADCNICDHVFIENEVVIGDRVTIKSGVQIWDGITLEDDVFIGPNATFTNDHFPRSKVYPEKFLETTIKKGASIGANATLLPGVSVGMYAMVGAGAVVTHSVPPYAIVYGNPAQIRGYTSTGGHADHTLARKINAASEPIGVGETRLYEMPLIHDLRGKLSFGEFGAGLPFLPQRYFLVFDVPGREIRGEHAHRTLHQLLICIKGSITVMVENGTERALIELDRPNLALHIPPLIWASQYNYSNESVLLVLASEVYQADDYIRDYDDYIRELGR